MTRDQLLSHLGNLAMDLPDDELAVLSRIAERLAMGVRSYGALSLARDPRNFAAEGREEVLDWAVYAACDLERRLRR